MKKAILIALMVLLMATIVLAVDINFRGKKASYLEINSEEKGITRISFSFSANDETKFRPTSVARGSLSITTDKRDRISLRLKKPMIITEEDGIITVLFDRIKISYRERTQICTERNGRERCRNKYVTTNFYNDVKVMIDTNSNTINIVSDNLVVLGIGEVKRDCCMVYIEDMDVWAPYCGIVGTEKYEEKCGGG